MATPIDIYDYELPERLIAPKPSKKRDECRLLYLNAITQSKKEYIFKDIVSLIDSDSFLVLNNTKVCNARLSAKKISGGALEFFVAEVLGRNLCKALIKGRVKIGQEIILDGGALAKIIDKDEDGVYKAQVSEDIFSVMDNFGRVPLPPYIEREAQSEDSMDYQTIYSKVAGSSAAPTAGLHFTQELISELRNKGVEILELTLDVGLGTFRPVKTQTLEEHKMHSERFYISPHAASRINYLKSAGKKLIAVGSTVVRALEAAARSNGEVASGENRTDILISDGFKFKVTDAMITNFHLPKSTLLAMVTAFGGYEFIMGAYLHAVSEEFRFFSYGDAMMIDKR